MTKLKIIFPEKEFKKLIKEELKEIKEFKALKIERTAEALLYACKKSFILGWSSGIDQMWKYLLERDVDK